MLADPALHALSLGAVFGTIAGILPPLAALVAIIWYAIQIGESKTVQDWLSRRRVSRAVKVDTSVDIAPDRPVDPNA